MLSRRFRKSFLLNQRKASRLKWNAGNLHTASHPECPACGATGAKLIAEVDRTGFPCDTVICDQCKLVFNDSYIESPTEFYSHEWASERWVEPEASFKRRSSVDSYAWKRQAFLMQTLGRESYGNIESVLEVGCGDGCNLVPYHLSGKHVTGCDFDDRFLRPGRELGMDLLQGDIDIVPSDQTYDLVMLVHAYEHVIDLNGTIEQVGKYLDAGGVVYIEVPGLLNWNRTRAQRLQEMGMQSSNNILNYLQMQHNYHFDMAHISYLWQRAGFKLIYGDEWVRAVFMKTADHIPWDAAAESGFWSQYTTDILGHLQQVEKDFASLGNLFCKGANSVIKKICNN